MRTWSATAALAAYAQLGGHVPLSDFWRGADPERAVLRNLLRGIYAGDTTCIELGVRFIEAQLGTPCIYAGYARARLARAFYHASLTAEQKERLSRHFLDMVVWHERTLEFREYLKLWPRVMQEDHRRQVRLLLRQRRPNAISARLQQMIDATA